MFIKKLRRNLAVLSVSGLGLLAPVALVGCDDDDPIEDAVEDVQDAAEDAADEAEDTVEGR